MCTCIVRTCVCTFLNLYECPTHLQYICVYVQYVYLHTYEYVCMYVVLVCEGVNVTRCIQMPLMVGL